MSNIVLSLQRVTKIFGGKGDVPLAEIFKGMNFNVKRNEVVGLSPSDQERLLFFKLQAYWIASFQVIFILMAQKWILKTTFKRRLLDEKTLVCFSVSHLIQEFSALKTLFSFAF